MHIYLVEDDPSIARLLQEGLGKWDLEVSLCRDFSRVLEEFKSLQPDLVLLDITLPSYNGYYWCQEIRKESQVPIIFLSARNENMDILMALQMGADDYITKPIDLNLTVSKIRALLRRTYAYSLDNHDWQFAGVSLNAGKSELLYQDQAIDLTKTELSIIETLFRAKGDYVSTNALLESCWDQRDFIDQNTLAVNISRLRKKLQEIGLEDFIVTKRNLGYRLNKDD